MGGFGRIHKRQGYPAVKQKQGEKMQKKMFAMDNGASMLGEVALVLRNLDKPFGLLFMNTLFDENACCHVAVGEGFQEVIEGS